MVQDEAAVSKDFVGLSLENPNSQPSQPSQLDDSLPPPPALSSEGIIPVDITRKFAYATKALAPGELIKDGYFTLFDSVGALEIMDPKMDSGCLAPGESLDEEYDVTRQLLPAEVIGIIDQLLCLEMAWHLGYPLSQTLFTNVYVEAIQMPEPKTIAEADFIRNRAEGTEADPMFVILRAYCLGLLKACWHVNQTIKSEHYYEEEDFVSNTYHRTLLEQIDQGGVRDVLAAARKVAHNLRHTIGAELSLALDCRLETRTAMLRAMELTELRSNPESLKLPWKQLQGVWKNIVESHGLGKPVPEAFSTKIQRRLASTMPPRPIVQLSFDEASNHWNRLFSDAIEVLDVLNFADSQSTMNFVLTFQAKKPQPLIYIRTLVQGFLFKDLVILGQYSVRGILDDDLATIVLPCSRLLDHANDEVEAPHDIRFALAHQMETFRQRVAPSYLDIFRAFCQNRCRVRRTLCHAIRDWETVQIDSEHIDSLLQVQLDEEPIMPEVEGAAPAYSLPLSSWAYLYKLRLMEWIVQLGFELETHQPDELAGMYWYLSYLARTRGQHLERIQTFVMRALTEQRTPPKTLTYHMECLYTQSLTYLRTMTLDAMVVTELADSLCCLYTALQRHALVPRPPRPYSNDELRYELRMKPFAAVGLPELPSFQFFTSASAKPDLPTGKLLERADQALVAARKGLEILTKLDEKEAFTIYGHGRWLAGMKNCMKSAIAASLAVTAAQKNEPAKMHVEVPKPDKGYHEWWIVPKISVER